jgi:hypothetical protein
MLTLAVIDRVGLQLQTLNDKTRKPVVALTKVIVIDRTSY